MSVATESLRGATENTEITENKYEENSVFLVSSVATTTVLFVALSEIDA